MSDSDRRRAHASAPQPFSQVFSQPFSQPSLDALALSDALAQMRAAGETPRLSQLLAALNFPADAAGPLADAVMAEGDDTDNADMLVGASADDTPVQLSPGTLRGLADIFRTEDAPAPAPPAPMEYRASIDRDERDEDERPALVAETPAIYQAHQAHQANQGGQEALRASVGLLALARGQRLDAGSLAAQVMLSSAALGWLDRVALPLDRQPEALVAHLVGALGVERARVCAALAEGEPLTGMDAQASLADLLVRFGELTPAQRRYWDALLSA